MKLLNLCFLFLLFLNATISSVAQTPMNATDISPLLIGEKIPPTTVSSVTGEVLSLQDIVKKKPSVVIFYRGGWCPFCNVHLAELQTIEQDILTLGYQIIAISPDSPENLQAAAGKHSLTYTLLSDADMSTAQAFGLAFAVPESSVERLKKSSGGKNPGQLPVPAVLVLNTEGEILFEYINPDYKKRISASLLLCTLETLK
jgi:peroxiredoxin